MPADDDVIVSDAPPEPEVKPEPPAPDVDPDAKPDEDPDEPLGPAGVKALQAEKEQRRKIAREKREAVREANELRAERDRLLADAEKAKNKTGDGDDTPDLDALRKEAADAAKAEARAEVLAERVADRIEVLSAKKFQDPEDALAQLMRTNDVEDFLDGGKVDAEAIKEALDELLEKKPYLGVTAQGGKRFQGSGDGGARKGPTGPSQLTEQDLKRMSPEEIVKAQQEGRFDDLLGSSR